MMKMTSLWMGGFISGMRTGPDSETWPVGIFFGVVVFDHSVESAPERLAIYRVVGMEAFAIPRQKIMDSHQDDVWKFETLILERESRRPFRAINKNADPFIFCFFDDYGN